MAKGNRTERNARLDSSNNRRGALPKVVTAERKLFCQEFLDEHPSASASSLARYYKTLDDPRHHVTASTAAKDWHAYWKDNSKPIDRESRQNYRQQTLSLLEDSDDDDEAEASEEGQ